MAYTPKYQQEDEEKIVLKMDYEHTEAHQRAYDLSVYLHSKVTTFPKKEKFVLQQEIRNAIDDVVDEIEQYEITKTASHIYAADRCKRRLVRKIRLAYDLKYLSKKSYEYIATEVGLMGACIGGLVKLAKESKRLKES